MADGLPTIIQDVFEPTEMATYLSSVLNVHKQNLVPLGLADYYWDCGKRTTLEHKTAAQFVRESGARLDSQLNKYLSNADDIGIVVDGFITPSPNGATIVWMRRGKYFVQQQTIDKDFNATTAYIWSLQQMGIPVFQFADLYSMAMGIASFVYNSLKPDSQHKTLKKHIRPQVFHPDPKVETLMGTSSGERGGLVGEVTGLKLIQAFGTPFGVYTAKWDNLVDIMGEARAAKFLRAIGRNP